MPFAALIVMMGLSSIFVHNFARIEIKDGRLFGAIIDIFNFGAPGMLSPSA